MSQQLPCLLTEIGVGHGRVEVPEQCAWKELKELKATVLTPDECSHRNSPEEEHASRWNCVSEEKRAMHQQVDVILNVKLFIFHRGESWFMLVLNLISCSMYVSPLKHVMILFTLFKVIFMAGKALNAWLLPVGVVLYCQNGSSFSRYLRLIGLIQWECSVCYGRKRLSLIEICFSISQLMIPLCRTSSSVELNPVRAFLSAQTVTLRSFNVHLF